MQITLFRKIRTKISTIGELHVDGKFFCYTIEDYDRGLKQTDKLEVINKVKVYAKTAIPEGTYKVIINMSNRFKRLLPLLLNVPGYEGVRIHPGNTAENTEGCILVGSSYTKDFVSNSRVTFNKLFDLMKDKKDITFTIKS